MPQYEGNFPQFTDFDPVLTDIFYQHYMRELGEGGVMALFGKRTSSKGKETDLRVGSFSDPKEFTGKVQYQDVERGYEVEYIFTPYVSGFQVSRQMRDDMQYDSIFSSASEMAIAFARLRRKHAASVFNNSTDATDYPGYDAVALCSASHPRSRTDTSNLVDNVGALPLTSDNLESSVVTMQALKDDLGEEITIMPDTLIVPRALRKTAIEITASPQIPENANNAVNVQAGAWNVIVDPYLSSSTAWWIVDSTMSQRYLKWYDRTPLEFNSMQDFETFMWKYNGYTRYGYGWSDFRWIYQGNT